MQTGCAGRAINCQAQPYWSDSSLGENMAHAKATIGTNNYAVAITTGHHQLNADEGSALGDKDTGPSPFEILCSALCACTAITLRMYAERKVWLLRGVQVDAHFFRDRQGGRDRARAQVRRRSQRGPTRQARRHRRAYAGDADAEEWSRDYDQVG